MKLLTLLKNRIKVAMIMANKTSLLTVSRAIFPAKVQSKTDYIIVDNETLIRTCIGGIPQNESVGGYPERMNPFLIADLLAIEGEDFRLQISYAINKVDNSEAIRLFDEADYLNRVDQDSYIDHKTGDATRQPPHIKKLQSNSYKRNIEALFDNDESMFLTAFIIVIKAKNEPGLRRAESQIKATFSGSRVFFEFPDTRHLETLINSCMNPYIWAKTACHLFSYHAALMLPIQSPGNRLQSEGTLFGETIETNPRAVMLNLDALSAQHMLVIGASGTGKTYFLMLFLMRALTMEHKRVIHITPKADEGLRAGEGTDHRKVIKYFNGCMIELGRDMTNNINPFEIFATGVTRANAESTFYFHVDILKNFFMAAILSETVGRDNMTSYLEKTIHQTYEKKGIYKEDPKTWHDWPYNEDIYRIWESEKDTNSTAEALYNKATALVGSWKYLNAPSNIDLTNDLICFDTSAMRADSEKLQDAFNVLITAMMSMRFKGNKDKNTIICVDEARVFLQNKQIASFLMRILMEGRSAGIGLVLAVQQPTDLKKADVADEVKTNINVYCVLGGMTPVNVGIVSTFLSLDSSAQDKLLSLGKGSGIVMVGNQVIPTSFKSTPLEHAIIKGENINAETQPASSVLSFVSPAIEELFFEQKICFDDWLTCDPELLRQKGFESQKGVDCMTGKNIRVWHKEIPENQTADHFATICRLAGAIVQAGHRVVCNHYDNADIIINEKIAIEYERPGSHTYNELTKKRDAALAKYTDVKFVCQAQNYELVKKAVGEERTITRGNELRKWIKTLEH